jgi:hypothetical protein
MGVPFVLAALRMVSGECEACERRTNGNLPSRPALVRGESQIENGEWRMANGEWRMAN